MSTVACEALAEETVNPVEPFLLMDRMPHIGCPGCGIGTTVNCFARAVEHCGIPLDKISIVSGIGCTGRVAGYVNLDSFHTTHGRPLPFATGLKLSRPDLKVIVYSGDGDLFAIGGNHFIHAARRNLREQLQLRDDRGAGGTDHAAHGQGDHDALRELRAPFQSALSRRVQRGGVRRPVDGVSRAPTD